MSAALGANRHRNIPVAEQTSILAGLKRGEYSLLDYDLSVIEQLSIDALLDALSAEAILTALNNGKLSYKRFNTEQHKKAEQKICTLPLGTMKTGLLSRKYRLETLPDEAIRALVPSILSGISDGEKITDYVTEKIISDIWWPVADGNDTVLSSYRAVQVFSEKARAYNESIGATPASSYASAIAALLLGGLFLFTYHFKRKKFKLGKVISRFADDSHDEDAVLVQLLLDIKYGKLQTLCDERYPGQYDVRFDVKEGLLLVPKAPPPEEPDLRNKIEKNLFIKSSEEHKWKFLIPTVIYRSGVIYTFAIWLVVFLAVMFGTGALTTIGLSLISFGLPGLITLVYVMNEIDKRLSKSKFFSSRYPLSTMVAAFVTYGLSVALFIALIGAASFGAAAGLAFGIPVLLPAIYVAVKVGVPWYIKRSEFRRKEYETHHIAVESRAVRDQLIVAYEIEHSREQALKEWDEHHRKKYGVPLDLAPFNAPVRPALPDGEEYPVSDSIKRLQQQSKKKWALGILTNLVTGFIAITFILGVLLDPVAAITTVWFGAGSLATLTAVALFSTPAGIVVMASIGFACAIYYAMSEMAKINVQHKEHVRMIEKNIEALRDNEYWRDRLAEANAEAARLKEINETWTNILLNAKRLDKSIDLSATEPALKAFELSTNEQEDERFCRKLQTKRTGSNRLLSAIGLGMLGFMGGLTGVLLIRTLFFVGLATAGYAAAYSGGMSAAFLAMAVLLGVSPVGFTLLSSVLCIALATGAVYACIKMTENHYQRIAAADAGVLKETKNIGASLKGRLEIVEARNASLRQGNEVLEAKINEARAKGQLEGLSPELKKALPKLIPQRVSRHHTTSVPIEPVGKLKKSQSMSSVTKLI